MPSEDLKNALDETAARVRSYEDADALERNALLAIIDGRFERADQLISLVGRRNALGLKTIKGGQCEPASPPRPS